MILRIFGAFLVIATTTLAGISFAAKEKYRLAELEELERAILLMKNRIAYLGTPLQEILEQIGWKTKGITGMAMQEIALQMGERQGGTAEEIWQRVWLLQGKESYFTAGDLEEIFSFGRTLSFLEKEQQQGSIDILLYYLREKQEQIKNRLEKNGRLYYSMGILSGLLLVVTLL